MIRHTLSDLEKIASAHSCRCTRQEDTCKMRLIYQFRNADGIAGIIYPEISIG
jgi:hypothetical protein